MKFLLFLILSYSAYADPLKSAIDIASSAMSAQSKRLEIIAENIANADSTASDKYSDPYRRKIIHFKNYRDKKTKNSKIKISKISRDKSEFIKKYDPNHPVADNLGYVLYPNVDKVIESIDAREAERSYNANLRSIEINRSLITKTLSILN